MYGENEVSSILEMLTDTLCSTQPTVRIGGTELPIQVVQERLWQLDRFHVEYVLDCMKATRSKIRNICTIGAGERPGGVSPRHTGASIDGLTK